MSAHSPAPWHTRFVGVEGEVHDDNGLWVAESVRGAANLAVIGAAPALLAAVVRMGCQDAGSCGPNEPDGRCFRCEALAKAGCL